jgi:hypothetical protein
MSADEMLAALLAKLSAPAPLPAAIDLWDTANIAAYLKRSADRVRSDIVCLPTFPKAIRLPVKGARALYKAREVIKWAESYTS